MKEQEFLKIFQYCRHDLLNELQLLHGYISINKMDSAKQAANDIITNIHKERHLINTGAPKFTLWILKSNHLIPNIKTSYEISLEDENLLSLDDKLVEICHDISSAILNYGRSEEIYQIHFELMKSSDILFKIHIKCLVSNNYQLINFLTSMQSNVNITTNHTHINCEKVFRLNR